MALFWSTTCSTSQKTFRNRSLIGLTKLFYNFYSQQPSKTVDLEVNDVMENFTSNLMQKKVEQWSIRKAKRQSIIEPCENHLNNNLALNIDNLSSENISDLIQNHFDNDNAEEAIILLKECSKRNKCPSMPILLNTLTYCGQNGYKDIIVLIQTMCKHHHPTMLKSNSNFDHFIAEAMWSKGNVHKAIDIFDRVYRENAYLRRRIRLMLKYLIVDLVNNRSEASLWVIIRFSENILKDFNDFYPISCVWQACFLSEWFTDQTIALDLLQRNSGLIKTVIPRISYVVFVSLKCHRTEVVYRLLELLLKYDMRQQYEQVLVSLLDYQFRNGDFSSCSEIIRWAVENNISLPQYQNMKLLNMILNQKMKTPMANVKEQANKTNVNLKF